MKIKWELRTDGRTVTDDMKRFRESDEYQKKLEEIRIEMIQRFDDEIFARVRIELM